jgi:hypothetical protein
VFEGFLASEIAKNRANRGLPRELYFFRDEQGLEIDLVTVAAGGKLRLLEVKWSRTITPSMAAPLRRLGASITQRPFESIFVHRGPASAPPREPSRPGSGPSP